MYLRLYIYIYSMYTCRMFYDSIRKQQIVIKHLQVRWDDQSQYHRVSPSLASVFVWRRLAKIVQNYPAFCWGIPEICWQTKRTKDSRKWCLHAKIGHEGQQTRSGKGTRIYISWDSPNTHTSWKQSSKNANNQKHEPMNCSYSTLLKDSYQLKRL